MKNYSKNNYVNPQTNPTNPQANPQANPANQPIRHQSNCLNRYLNRITKDNHSIILYDKEPNQNEKSFWKLFYKSPSRLFCKTLPWQYNLQPLKNLYKNQNEEKKLITIATNLNANLPWHLIQQKVKEPTIKAITMHKVNNHYYKNTNKKSLGTILQSCTKYFPM